MVTAFYQFFSELEYFGKNVIGIKAHEKYFKNKLSLDEIQRYFGMCFRSVWLAVIYFILERNWTVSCWSRRHGGLTMDNFPFSNLGRLTIWA